MFYFPLLELYQKYKRRINDFFVQIIIYLTVYLIDSFAISKEYNFLSVSMFAMICIYVLARFVIIQSGQKENFGMFVNEKLYYCIILAISSWLAYFLFIRLRLYH